MHLDCELGRLRVTRDMKQAVEAAARAEGINPAAWRKRAYTVALMEHHKRQWSEVVDFKGEEDQ